VQALRFGLHFEARKVTTSCSSVSKDTPQRFDREQYSYTDWTLTPFRRLQIRKLAIPNPKNTMTKTKVSTPDLPVTTRRADMLAPRIKVSDVHR
jgi:hypothetical protein